MHLDTFRSLLTPVGQQALQAAAELSPKEADFLPYFQALSRHYPPDLARAALGIAILRRAAQMKFPFAEKLFFTREALEQASSYEISTYRAKRYQGYARLIDLGCSVGGDTLALAQVAPTLGIDNDPLRLAMAQANLQALGLIQRTRFVLADLNQPLPLARTTSAALFFDPSRRSAQRRIYSVLHYQPPLSVINDWLPDYPALGVKLSPGVDLNELSAYDAEIEFISLKGELKEAVLWFGALKTTRRRATLLPEAVSLVSEFIATSTLPESISPSQPLGYIYEPDPAILRAGLVRQLAELLDARQLDPDIAYLTTNLFTETPFARCWQVKDWFPFQLKKLRTYLRQHDIGKVVVKKRGSPLQPEALIHQLRLQGEQEKMLFLTHLRGKPIVIIASELLGKHQ